MTTSKTALINWKYNFKIRSDIDNEKQLSIAYDLKVANYRNKLSAVQSIQMKCPLMLT